MVLVIERTSQQLRLDQLPRYQKFATIHDRTYHPDYWTTPKESAINLFAQFILETDRSLVDSSGDLVANRPVATDSEINTLYAQFSLNTATVLLEHNTVGIAPLFGTVKLLEIMQTDPQVKNIITPIIISGTEGTTVTRKQIQTDLPESITKGASVVLIEDIIDTGATISESIAAILGKRGQENDSVHSLTHNLEQTFGKGYENYRRLYKKLVEQMKKADLVVAAPIWKNKPLFDAISEAVADKDDPWSVKQRNLLKHVKIFPADEWLFGSGLDTNIKLGDLLDVAANKYNLVIGDHPILTHLSPYLVLRTGFTVDGMHAFEGKYPDLVDWYAQKFAEFIDKSASE